jgi:small basic protein
MWLPALALIVGFFVVYLIMPSPKIPTEYSSYIAIALVAGLDSIVGGVRGVIEEHFSDKVFVGGFFTNAAMAALLLFLANRLGVNHAEIAIMVALVFRIFNNLGFIRRYVFARLFERRINAEKNFPEP